MRIVVSEIALEALLIYSSQDPEHSQRVGHTLHALAEDGHDRHVLKLSGSPRPIWTQPLDQNTVIYFTYGHGTDALELRIALIGPPATDPKSDLRRVLYAAGDVPYQEIPDSIRMDEHRTASTRPELPARVLDEGTSLQNYLAPTEDALLEALSDSNQDADDLHGRRYRILTGLRSAHELPIRLSPQQERLLGSPLPLLFQGVAGSGKTTVVARFAHRQLLAPSGTPSVLIITYTEELRQFTEAILKSLDDLEPAQSSSIHVRTWRELCDDLAGRARITPFDWAPEDFFLDQIRLKVDTSAMVVNTRHLEYEVQEFIRSTLKGQALDPENPPPPPRGTVIKMAHTPLDGQIDRGTLYDLAQQYQRVLAMNGLSDDTDAARRLLTYIDTLPKYDYVMVDEAQDYTLVQLLLLSRLCRRMEGILLAGDVDQIVHSVDFTWAKARQAIWRAWNRPPPEPVTIDYNYRNPQPVSELANALLEMRSRELAMSTVTPALSNQALTPRPVRLILPEAELERLVIDLASKIGSFGIIRKDQSDDIFINGIKMERSFTPRLVKGLEFNVVCLINFNEDYKDLAARMRGGPPSHLRRQFNEVYVSVTRTRAQLLLLDRCELQAGLWESRDMFPLIDDAESVAALTRLVTARFENRTRKDWEFDALEFESVRAYAAAGECWERSGRPEDAARNYERAGRLEKALDIYRGIQDFKGGARIALRLGRQKDAAEFLELDGQLSKAAEVWAGLGKWLEAARLYQRAAEQGLPGGDWSIAGEHYAAGNAHDVAAMCYVRAGDQAKAAECWLVTGEFLRAADVLERLGRKKEAAAARARFHTEQGEFQAAAEQWLAAGDPGRAAAQFEQLGEWVRAAESWLAAGESGRAAARFEQAGECARAAESWLAAGDLDRAAAQFQQISLWAKTADAVTSGEHGQAAVQFEQAGDWARAAESWLAAGEPGLAAARFEQAGDWTRAAECWLAARNQGRAAAEFERADDFTRAAECWLAAGDPTRAAAQFKRAGDVQRLLMMARSLEANRQFGAAATAYSFAGRRVKAGWMAFRRRFS